MIDCAHLQPPPRLENRWQTTTTEDLALSAAKSQTSSPKEGLSTSTRATSKVTTDLGKGRFFPMDGAAVARGVDPGAVGSNPAPVSGHLSGLAERLARAEETVGRAHETGLLYRQVCVVILLLP